MSDPDGVRDPAAAVAAAVVASGARRILLAVSGGSDSLALLRIAATASETVAFVAATVDHGLRPEAAEEAQWVARHCAEAGVPHSVLTWAGEKPASGVQEQARLARYRLLVDEALARSCDALMTAHTADDQAETVFMRLARGSGVRGLAGIQPTSRIAVGAGEPVLVLRPLLAISRQFLREGLRHAGRRWIDDPSNEDLRYERIRVRGLLAALEEQGLLSRDALVATAIRMRLAAERQEAADHAAFDRYEGVLHGLGFVRLRATGDMPASLVGRIIRAVGAGDHEPAEADASRALAQALAAGASTLGGAMLKREGDALYVFREPAAVLGRAGVPGLARTEIPSGAPRLWDRRFIIGARADESGVVEPLGRNPDLLGRMASLHRCPAEALMAAPDSGGRLPTRSLLPERFHGKVMRIA
ncbi:MAG: tRNA lysidine(34) synthetase TilS [Parvularculaceae bacterium]|nr:tRNA lysidine(34) synthetase TilS [Parvularculaceae bacterium]